MMQLELDLSSPIKNYPLHHSHIHIYNTRYFQVVTHIGNDQAQRRLISVIVRRPVFQRDLTVNLSFESHGLAL